MKQLAACLALLGILVQAKVLYPQAMTVHSVDEGENGNYTVTLCDSGGEMYGVDTDMNDLKPGELMAVIMYSGMTPNNPADDEVVAMRHSGFFFGEDLQWAE